MTDDVSREAEVPEGRFTGARSGVIVSYLYSIGQIVVNLLYVPLLINGIGASEYGLYQLIGSVIAYMTLMNTTFAGGVTRFYCKYLAEGNREKMETTLAMSRFIYRIASIAAVVLGIFAIVGVRIVYANVLTEFQLMESTIMLVVLVANLIITMHNTISVAALTAYERFVFLKGTQLLSIVLQPIVIVVLIAYAPYALVIACVQLALNSLCALAQTVYRVRVLDARAIMHTFDKTLLKSLLVFSSAIVLVLIADQVFWKTNQLVLGYFFGTEVVAVYGVAAQVLSAFSALGVAISTVFMPRFSQLYSESADMKPISDLFTRIGRISLYPLLLILFGFALFGREFIVLWAGADFEEAYLIALVIMVPYTIDLAQNSGLIILQVMDKFYFRGKMYLAIAVVNLAAVIFIAPVHGALGTAICTAVMMFIGNVIAMNAYYRHIGLDVKGYWMNSLRVAAPLLLFSAAVGVVIWFSGLSFSTWPSLIGALAVFTVLFAAVALAFSANAYERDIVARIPKKLLRR